MTLCRLGLAAPQACPDVPRNCLRCGNVIVTADGSHKAACTRGQQLGQCGPDQAFATQAPPQLYDFDLSSLICFAASQRPYSSLLRAEATADTVEQEVALTTFLMRYHCCLSGVAWYHDRLAYLFGTSIISAMGLSLLCSDGVVGTCLQEEQIDGTIATFLTILPLPLCLLMKPEVMHLRLQTRRKSLFQHIHCDAKAYRHCKKLQIVPLATCCPKRHDIQIPL